MRYFIGLRQESQTSVGFINNLHLHVIRRGRHSPLPQAFIATDSHESEDPRSKKGTSCRADTYSVTQTRSPTLSGKEKVETADQAACCCLVNLQEGMLRTLGPHGEHFSTCTK